MQKLISFEWKTSTQREWKKKLNLLRALKTIGRMMMWSCFRVREKMGVDSFDNDNACEGKRCHSLSVMIHSIDFLKICPRGQRGR